MVALLLLVVGLLFAGFGTALEPTGGPAGVPDEGLAPPPVLLVSTAGEQAGVQGSACVDGPSEGMCTDTIGPVEPEELSIVRPGEQVTIVIPAAEELDGTVSVRWLGCDEEVASFPLTAPTNPWTVDLDPGVYQLDIVARFEGGGLSGDTTVALGLLVDDEAPLEILPGSSADVDCSAL